MARVCNSLSSRKFVYKTLEIVDIRNVAQDTSVHYSVGQMKGGHCANTANLCSAIQGCSKNIRKKLTATLRKVTCLY